MNREEMYLSLGVSKKVLAFGETVLDELKPRFAEIEQIAELNQTKVIAAMQKNRVNATHFAASTGYGYDDEGRDNLERVYASAFHTEAALVRPQITCGTHALAVALSANLLPGDELLSPVGRPYDTLEEVIGIRESACSLKEYGVSYAEVPLKADGSIDYDGVRAAINARTKLVTIQRSKGYATRPTLSVKQIGELIAFVKSIRADIICMVDNCYGEFVETIEPSDVGADMIVGSLIKNPGGGLAPMGGYVAGRADLVEQAAERLTLPGIGSECGASLGVNRTLFQGFFFAPHTVSQALKTMAFAAGMLEELGFESFPASDEKRSDIIQTIRLKTADNLVKFCQGIQKGSPVDSFALPVPAPMPGYESPVVMAAGTFIQGASLELSCDGPVREPYLGFLQGGLTFESGKLGVLSALSEMLA